MSTVRPVAPSRVSAVREQPLGQSDVSRFHGRDHSLGEIPLECGDDRRGVAIGLPLLDLAAGDFHPRREPDLEVEARRKDGGAENLAIIRKLALNVLKRARPEISIRRKLKRSGWSDAFARSILGQMR